MRNETVPVVEAAPSDERGERLTAACAKVFGSALASLPDSAGEAGPDEAEAFEQLCREHDIAGTAAARQCEVFWRAGAAFRPAPHPVGSALTDAQIKAIGVKFYGDHTFCNVDLLFARSVIEALAAVEKNRAEKYARTLLLTALAAHPKPASEPKEK